MQRLSDGRDLVSLGQVAPDLQVLSEDRLLWKKLCQYHFTDRQVLPPLACCTPLASEHMGRTLLIDSPWI